MRASRIRSGMACAALIGGFLMVTGAARAQNKTFIIIDDEASVEDLIPLLTSGDGTASVETDDPYPDDDDHDAALRVDSPAGDNQKYNANIPDWGFQIVDGATAADEFQYITFAWLKGGDDGMQLQLSAEPGGWSHRYNGGGNPKGWNPSIDVSDDTPYEWQVHTRDMVEDWGEMVLNGMAFSPGSGDFGIFDHVVLHQAPEDPLLPQAVDARGKSAAVWGDIKRDIR